MAQSSGQSGTAEPITGEYFTWESADAALRVHMHLAAIDEMARGILERSQGLPVEVGGLLLGHVTRGERPAIWIERHSRIECEHRSGPGFALSADELAALETRAAEVSGELNVLGFYRSHLRPHSTGPDFGLDEADRELIARYFKDPEDIFLLVGPTSGKPDELRAQFFAGGADSPAQPLVPGFPFRGRPAVTPETSHGERLGRLVPDFIPAAPRIELRTVEFPSQVPQGPDDLELTRRNPARRWPFLAALLLVGTAAAVLFQQNVHRPPSADPQVAEAPPVLPLGLSVDPTGPSWRISWNTPIRNPRAGQLFIRDGADDQNRIELSPEDLKSGASHYQAKSGDVTVRLEVTDTAGHISAESFRVLKTVEKAAAPTAPAAEVPPATAATPPKAVDKVAPVVPASIRPRIRGKIPIEVRVQVDAQGRVTSATPVTRAHSGLETFLAGRAVAAAKQWKFKPARANGKPVAGSEIIHFTFEK